MAGRRKLQTTEDFKRALKNSYGLGQGESYKPWLRVEDVNSPGNSGKINGLKINRCYTSLSENESCFFYLAEFSDSVIDIRDQFPLLPLDLSIRISCALGLKHPTIPSTKTPNVMTTDFLLTRTDGIKIWYEAVSVKPEDKFDDKRTAEKLDIERVWWELQGVPFHIFTTTDRNKIQSRNIQWATSPVRQGRIFDYELLVLALDFITVGLTFVESLCNTFIDNLAVEHDDALTLLKTLIAKKMVLIDLNNPIADTGILHVTGINKRAGERIYAG
ncbi:heteromeric transposase endonuclease subunit TnsA [Zobellella endophytica]|uniref:Heteromeric transposase endonuclease subunit TnsA n=1 Tax=Zobellella endophytica TaxID=2116700 RepID=A0A2P7R4V5_9GAMM|nr:TnsA endonuclease N-terminal domain-containing protein [Zobellella endophytica]PSJ45243.1 heteromeric transposase endonuclease subunit TnsA [Zobellella endophytica]